MHLDHILAHVEQLPYLAELLVRLLEVVSVLSDLLGELHNLQQVLLVHLKGLVQLKRLPRDVEKQVFSAHDTLEEVSVLWNQVLVVNHEEDPPCVQLDVVLPLLSEAIVELARLQVADVIRPPNLDRPRVVQLFVLRILLFN